MRAMVSILVSLIVYREGICRIRQKIIHMKTMEGLGRHGRMLRRIYMIEVLYDVSHFIRFDLSLTSVAANILI